MANISNVKVKQGNVLSLSGSSVEITGSTTTVGGDLNVLGTVTAQELIVNTITSASTVFTSGSTQFGDNANDSHTFSGSVNVFGLVSSSVGFSGSGAGLTNLTGASSQFPNFQQDVRNQLSGVGAINYNPANGQISTTALTAAITQINAGDNIVVTNPTGSTTTIALTSSITGGLDNIKVTNEVSGAVGRFTTLSASTAEFSGNVLIYGTASLSSNPEAAYVRFDSVKDKIVIFPGLDVSGSSIVSGNLNVTGSVSASSFTGSGAGLTNLPAANLSGVVPLANGGTGQSLSGDLTGKLLIGSGSSLVTGSLIAGTNVGIVTGSGSITINVTGSLGISQVTSSDPNLEIQNGTGPVVTASLNTTLTGLVSVTTDELTVNTTAVLTGQVRLSITAVTASYLVQDTDNVLMVTNTGTITITLPSEPVDGRLLIVKKKTNSIETVTLDGIEVDGESTFDLNGPYQSVTLVAYDDRWFIT
jgi:hypothetical protein